MEWKSPGRERERANSHKHITFHPETPRSPKKSKKMNYIRGLAQKFKESTFHVWKAKRGFDRNSHQLPPLIQSTADWIETHALQEEGIFRISGNKQRIDLVKRIFDSGKHFEFSEKEDPHDVAGVLKAFLIEPEESLLTSELYECWLEAVTVKNEQSRLQCLITVLSRVPSGSMLVLTRVFRLLKDIAKNSEVNKMTIENLSTIFAPTLLRKQDQSIQSIIDDSSKANLLVETLIRHFDTIFVKKKVEMEREDNSPEALYFYETLRKGTIKLAQTRLKETENFSLFAAEVSTSSVPRVEEFSSRGSIDFGTPPLSKKRAYTRITSNDGVSQIWYGT